MNSQHAGRLSGGSLSCVVLLNATMARVCLSVGEACSAAADTGPCRAAIQMFYYNTQTSRCEEFTYGGCEGNANKYDTEAECQRACASSSNKRRNEP